MRKLKTKDMFSCARVLKSLDAKNEIHKICQNADTLDDVWNSGFELVYNLFEAAAERNSENLIYEFLAGPFEMEAESIAELDISDFFDMAKQLAKENNLTRFFKNAAELTK